ncbi:cell division protein FtsA [Desnuesiella massiliensis]|uniref:cell division protein FtsA n=1 Tax=Desnuesiella massiliensis TaxID=1650662 RepID=UPI0006E36FEB|nr:cell division protein FtsA [Desnuesiella massiliensis]
MINEYIVGVEVGSSKVSATIGKLDKFGGLKILGSCFEKCTGVKKGIIINIDSVAEVAKACLDNLQKMIDVPINKVYLSIPSGMCRIISSKGVIAISDDKQEIKKEDIKRVMEVAKIVQISKDEEIVDSLSEQYIVDDYTNIDDPVGMKGSRLEVDAKIITCKSLFLNNLNKSIDSIDLQVAGTIIQALADYSHITENADKSDIALVDVGADVTNISFFKKGVLTYTSILPLGGSNITSDIAICSGMPLEEAEEVKIKYGALNKNYEDVILKASNGAQIQRYTLEDIIEARVEEILKFILKELNKTGYYNDIKNIYVYGGGIALFDGIKELSEEVLEKPVLISINSENHHTFTSLGIVKSVFNEVKLEYETLSNRFEKTNSYENEEDVDTKNNFFSKVKRIIGEFF